MDTNEVKEFDHVVCEEDDISIIERNQSYYNFMLFQYESAKNDLNKEIVS